MKVDTEKAGGTRYSADKPRVTIAPYLGFKEVMKVAEVGAVKYDDNDWRKGQSFTTLINSCMRHLLDLMDGKDIDSETGQLHAAHAAWNMCTLAHFMAEGRQGELDDRYGHCFLSTAAIASDDTGFSSGEPR